MSATERQNLIMSYFYDKRPSTAYVEMLDAGRARWTKTLTSLAGHGSSVESVVPMTDIEKGVEFDRYTIVNTRSIPSDARRTMQTVALNATFIGDAHAHIDIAHSLYDTRWMRVDWTVTQRNMACMILLAALCFIGCAIVIERYRITE